jgi:glutamyl-tRNA reductase
VSFASVQYIFKNVEDIASKNILLFGTGKIGRNTCENLVKHTKHEQITLINRTKEKAEKLRLENERKRQEAFKFFININKENSSHHENLEYKNGYFSNYKMTIWKYDFKPKSRS